VSRGGGGDMGGEVKVGALEGRERERERERERAREEGGGSLCDEDSATVCLP